MCPRPLDDGGVFLTFIKIHSDDEVCQHLNQIFFETQIKVLRSALFVQVSALRYLFKLALCAKCEDEYHSCGSANNLAKFEHGRSKAHLAFPKM